MSAPWQGASGGRRVATAVVLVGVLAGVTKLVGGARDVVLARSVGSGGDVDALVLVLTVPMFMVNVLAGSVPAILVPYLARAEKRSRDAATRVFSAAATAQAFLLASVAVGLMVFAAPVVDLLGGSLAPPDRADGIRYLRILALVIVFEGLGVMASAALHASGRFRVVAAVPVISSMSCIAALLSVERGSALDAFVLALVGASAVEFSILTYAASRRGWRIRRPTPDAVAVLIRMLRAWPPVVAISASAAGLLIIDQAMAARLGPSRASWFAYGTRIDIAVLGVMTLAVGSVGLRYFSDALDPESASDRRRVVRKACVATFSISALVALAVIVLSQPVVELTFVGGEFNADDASRVIRIQQLYAIQIPFAVTTVVLVRVQNARSISRGLFAMAAASLVLDVSLNFVLGDRMGVEGIALATSVTAGFVMVLMGISVGRSSGSALAKSPGLTPAGDDRS